MSDISKLLLLARECVHKQREVERLEDENKKLKAAINKFCKDCWAFRGSDPAQCRVCAFFEYKE